VPGARSAIVLVMQAPLLDLGCAAHLMTAA
jgi:hypothetical protein